MSRHLQKHLPGQHEEAQEASLSYSGDGSKVSLLMVGSNSPGKTSPTVSRAKSSVAKHSVASASITVAASLARAMDLMRVMSFDLVVVSEDLPAAKVIRRLWRWQPWVYVGFRVLEAEEIEARSLGAVAVVDELDCVSRSDGSPDVMPVLIEIAQAVSFKPRQVKQAAKQAG